MTQTKETLLQAARANIQVVNLEQAATKIADGAIILDVREASEYDLGHLQNAVHIPRGLLEFVAGSHPALQNPDAPLIVYCKNGGRATLATDVLVRMGYQQAYMLAGGIDAWSGELEVSSNQYPS